MNDGENNSIERVIDELCKSKAEEFQFYGYDSVTANHIWQCVSEKYGSELPPLYQLTNDILTLKVSQFMNWMTLNAYKGVDLDE